MCKLLQQNYPKYRKIMVIIKISICVTDGTGFRQVVSKIEFIYRIAEPDGDMVRYYHARRW